METIFVIPPSFLEVSAIRENGTMSVLLEKRNLVFEMQEKG